VSFGEVIALIGGAAAIGSATASARSARIAAIVTRPWVRGRVSSTSMPGGNVDVTVSNEGAGLAVDLLCRVEGIDAMADIASLGAGDSRPAGFVAPPGIDMSAARFVVVTEFSDLTGARWRATTRGGRSQLSRLRSTGWDVWRRR
jgi:hypothetical protein